MDSKWQWCKRASSLSGGLWSQLGLQLEVMTKKPRVRGEGTNLEPLEHRLQQWALELEERSRRCAGYPVNFRFNLERFFETLMGSGILQLSLNDAGRPDRPSPYGLNSRDYEKEVLQSLAELYRFPEENFWGYVTSGGTQGNLQGMWMGREALRPHGRPVIYASEEAHYSVPTLAHVLDVDLMLVKSKLDGSMDVQDLKERAPKDRPALLVASLGTTFKGGIDDSHALREALEEKGVPQIYTHLDAALFGGYIPYLYRNASPFIDFSVYPHDSIAVSGHKFYGSPVPLGVFLCREQVTGAMREGYVPYLEMENCLIPCSRSALNTLIWWWTLNSVPRDTLQAEALAMMQNAEYLRMALIDMGLGAWRNTDSCIVYFSAPSQDFCRKWCLPQVQTRTRGVLTHIVVMQQIDRELIEQLLAEMKREIS